MKKERRCHFPMNPCNPLLTTSHCSLRNQMPSQSVWTGGCLKKQANQNGWLSHRWWRGMGWFRFIFPQPSQSWLVERSVESPPTKPTHRGSFNINRVTLKATRLHVGLSCSGCAFLPRREIMRSPTFRRHLSIVWTNPDNSQPDAA